MRNGEEWKVYYENENMAAFGTCETLKSKRKEDDGGRYTVYTFVTPPPTSLDDALSLAFERWLSGFCEGMAPVGAVICGIILAERWTGPWKGQLSHLAETGEPIGQGSYEDNTRFVTTLQLRLPPGSTASGPGMNFKAKVIIS